MSGGARLVTAAAAVNGAEGEELPAAVARNAGEEGLLFRGGGGGAVKTGVGVAGGRGRKVWRGTPTGAIGSGLEQKGCYQLG